MSLASTRGESHLGSEVNELIVKGKEKKIAFKNEQQKHQKDKSPKA